MGHPNRRSLAFCQNYNLSHYWRLLKEQQRPSTIIVWPFPKASSRSSVQFQSWEKGGRKLENEGWGLSRGWKMDVSSNWLMAAARAPGWKDWKVACGVIGKGTIIDCQCLP